MLHFLAPIRTDIGEDPIAAVFDAQTLGDEDDELQERVTFATLPAIEIVERDDVLSRNHQHVLRGLGVHVSKSHETRVLQDDIAGNNSAGDATEYAVIHGG